MTHRAKAISVDVLLGGAVVMVVGAPLLFTDSGFALDFTNHLWLTWVAGKDLITTGHPSYFLNVNGLGIFYPLFAFYGGTLYTVTGAISELLGNPVLAYVGITLLAIAGCYGGTLWLGRQLGLHGLIAHAPPVAVLTSAYYITDLYGRGAWTELVAVSMLAPLLASALHLVRARTWRVCPVLVFVVSAVLFSGSHNITLVWGTTIGACALLTAWLVLGAPRRLPYRRLAMVAGLGAVSLLVNSWFLLPDIAYQGDVVARYASQFSWAETSFFNTPAVLLDPFRMVPGQSTTPALFVQAPDWFLAWGLVTGGVLVWSRGKGYGLRRALIGAVVFVGLILGMMMVKPFWSIAPFPFTDIQFPYRLDSYLVYAVAGLVLVVALGLQRAAQAPSRSTVVTLLRLALVGAVAISFGLCVWQQWIPSTLFSKSYTNRGQALASVNELPRSWYDIGSYKDLRAPIVAVPKNRLLVIDPSRVHGDRFAGWISVPPGPAPIQTDIDGGDYLVHISGLRWLGRSEEGWAVVSRVNGGSGPVYVVVETAHSSILELGRILSILAIAAILVVVARTAVHGRRKRGDAALPKTAIPAGAQS